MTAKQLNIKKITYYFYNDLINTLNFEPINLKLGKKTWKDIDIYYIGYVDKNEPEDWRVKSVNPLYLIINKIFCIAGEKIGVKYLKIEKNHSDPVLNKWNQVFDSSKYLIKTISNEEVNFNDGFNKIKFVSDDSLRLNKIIYFPTLTVAIICALKKGDLFYPQVYLDDALYQLKKGIFDSK